MKKSLKTTTDYNLYCRGIFLCCAAANTLVGQIAVPDNKCAITFRVINPLDSTVVPYAIKSFTNSQNQEYAAEFRGLTARVPCATYNAVLQHALYSGDYKHILYLSKSNLQLRVPETWVTLQSKVNVFVDLIGNTLGAIDFDFPDSVAGRVDPAPGSADMWVQFQESFAEKSYQVKVDADGSFRLHRLPGLGRYIVHITKDGRLVHLESVFMAGPERILFKIPNLAPIEPPTLGTC